MKDYKFKIQLPDNFDEAASIGIPAFIPVHDNFDHSKLIAEAVCRKQDNFLIVNVNPNSINDYFKNKKLLAHEIGGTIVEQENGIIKRFNLQSVSIIPKLSNH